MNLNRTLINKQKATSIRNRHFQTRIRGPAKATAPKRKSVSSTSSATNWGPVLQDNNSTLRSISTSISAETESRIVMALTEGRGDARCEVGLASIDVSHPVLVLCQLSDLQSYINTLTKINVLNPTDILVPSTFVENAANNRLVDKIKKQFPNIKIIAVPRKTFNKTNGLDKIMQLCLSDPNAIHVGLQHKYYCLAAASALISGLQLNFNIYYANGTLNILYQESEGYACIDISTVDRLELVSSAKPNQSSRYSTLFGVLNYCYTRIGSRLLRSRILQPPFFPSIIKQTLNCVTELLAKPQILLSIQIVLQKLVCIDLLLSLNTINCHDSTDVGAERQINYLLFLNNLLDIIQPLKDIIENCKQPFFTELIITLQSDIFGKITSEIRTLFNPYAQFTKGASGIHERCFAIKSGINGLLDLTRKKYSEILNQMEEYVKELASKYDLPLSIAHNNNKGYHIKLKLNSHQRKSFNPDRDLPSEFIQVFRLVGSCTMKTNELINLSTRLEDVLSEIIKMSKIMIHDIIVSMKQYMGFFYKLAEDISHLDLFQSLAEASKRGRYIRPEFGEYTDVVSARHPMLEMLLSGQHISNPIHHCQDYNIHVITGPNGSGKSIYIRQLMLLQIMAQTGCYVPVSSGKFKPMKHMFARIYLEDDMDYGASSFMLEMQEVKYMMSLASKDSLFIIDELCRSTAADEGAALAFAICEKFSQTDVILYVTTHYSELTNLAQMYLNVQSWQMETIASGATPLELDLNFLYRLVPGNTSLKYYAVWIVQTIWPRSMLEEVYRVLDYFEKKECCQKEYGEICRKESLKYKLHSEFRKLRMEKNMTRNRIKNFLMKNRDLFFELGTDLAVYIATLDEISDKDTENREDSQSGHALNDINVLIPEISIRSSENALELPNGSSCNDTNLPQPGVIINNYSSKVVDERRSTKMETCQQTGGTQNDFLTKGSVEHDLQELGPLESSIEYTFQDKESRPSEGPEDTWLFKFPADGAYNREKNSSSSFRSNKNNLFKISSENESFDSMIESNKENSIDTELVPNNISLSKTTDNTLKDMVEVENKRFIDNSVNEKNESSKATKGSDGYSVKNISQKEISFTENNNFVPDEADDFASFIFSPLCSCPASDKNIDKISKSESSDTEENKTSNNQSVDKPSTDKDGSKVIETSRSPKTSQENRTLTDNIVQFEVRKPVRKRKIIAPRSLVSKKMRKQTRFIPPKKLTKKQIEEEFAEQDKKFYESSMTESECAKLYSKRLKRPSVRDMLQCKHLAFTRRTENGVEVIPVNEKPATSSFDLKRNISNSQRVDVSIFSDKNAKSFDQFFNSNERSIKKFKFVSEQEIEEKKSEDSKQNGTENESNQNFQICSSWKMIESKGRDENIFGATSQNRNDSGEIYNIIKKYLGHSSVEVDNNKNLFDSSSLQESDLEI